MPCDARISRLTIDGMPRSYRDDPQIAHDAARYLKVCNPKSKVTLRDIQTNVSTPVDGRRTFTEKTVLHPSPVTVGRGRVLHWPINRGIVRR